MNESKSNILLSAASDLWYTPPHIVGTCARALGIDRFELDAASDPYGNKIVRADRYFDSSALNRPWTARSVWCNPPGGRMNNVANWIMKAIGEFDSAAFHVGALLMFRVGVETAAFQYLLQRRFPICFPRKRIEFIAPPGSYEPGTRSQPTHGNAIIGFTRGRYARENFASVMYELGEVLYPDAAHEPQPE